jgi:twitching motility protein PilU
MNAHAKPCQVPEGLSSLLEHMIRIEASHLHLSAGSPPVFRVDDVTYPGRVAIAGEEIAAMLESIANAPQRAELRANLELTVPLELPSGDRFRAHVFLQRGAPAMVVRSVQSRIESLAALGLPAALKEIALSRRGLVLLAGDLRSGKSTTMAALIDERNTSATGHILTVEESIEFVHAPKQCVITQREVGTDTRSYLDGLRSARRHAPDMIAVDALRSADTLDALLELALDGHLCITSLCAESGSGALERLLGLHAAARQPELVRRLSSALRALVFQRIVPSGVGRGRTVVLEIIEDRALLKRALESGNFETVGQAVVPSPSACALAPELTDETPLRLAPDPYEPQPQPQPQPQPAPTAMRASRTGMRAP